MSYYRKIDVRMWGDAKFRKLSAHAKMLWIYLLTGPRTTSLPGLFEAGEAGLAEALGWGVEGFREAFREVSGKGMAEADWEARVVWVPNVVKYNPPESPNVVKSWRSHWDAIPECPLKDRACLALAAASPLDRKGFREAFREAFGEAFAKALPNQEQEQEQEQEPSPPTPSRGEAEVEGGGARSQEKAAEREAAGRVVAHFQCRVGNHWTEAGGVEAVLALLGTHSEADLLRATSAYAAWCDATEKVPKNRQAAKRFFSPDPQFTAAIGGRLDVAKQPAAAGKPLAAPVQTGPLAAKGIRATEAERTAAPAVACRA